MITIVLVDLPCLLQINFLPRALSANVKERELGHPVLTQPNAVPGRIESHAVSLRQLASACEVRDRVAAEASEMASPVDPHEILGAIERTNDATIASDRGKSSP